MSPRLLGHAAKAVDARSSRSRQRKVGASEIGVCRRRAAYSHHGRPYSDPDNVTGIPAIVGTWIHKGALDTMRREWGTLIETTVEDDLLRGHIDGLDLPNEWRVKAGLEERADAPDVIEVDDLKTKRDGRMVDYVRVKGPKRSELYQVHLYADLLRRGKVKPLKRHAALAALGPLPVERIRLRYFPRTGEDDVEYVHEQAFDEDVAAEAWEWVTQVSSSTSPDDVPRDQDGPGLSIVCDHCPFLTACWGDLSGDVKPQAQLLVTDRDLAETLAEYDRQRAIESAAKTAKDLARAKLDGTGPAIYVPDPGDPGFRLKWSGGNEVPESEEVDLDAMVAVFEAAEIKVPTKPVPARRTARTISVTPWEAPDEECGKGVGGPVPWTAPDGVVWTQDQPRGGWSSSAGDTLTAGKFSKQFTTYDDPRPACILPARHAASQAHVGADHVVDLDVDEATA